MPGTFSSLIHSTHYRSPFVLCSLVLLIYNEVKEERVKESVKWEGNKGQSEEKVWVGREWEVCCGGWFVLLVSFALSLYYIAKKPKQKTNTHNHHTTHPKRSNYNVKKGNEEGSTLLSHLIWSFCSCFVSFFVHWFNSRFPFRSIVIKPVTKGLK